MNKYKITGTIGSGVLANVLKISKTDAPEDSNLVLKEIECLDINSAKNALEELRIFHELDHRFLCKLKDSFLRWDKTISVVYVCYVMDYFESKTLANYLNEKRDEKQSIEYELVKKWLANIADVVHYLHRIGIVHRNLKPGSFYIKPSDATHQKMSSSSLLLGDFCVHSMAKDVRTKTRISERAFDYTAPEVSGSSQSYTHKSDVWSIGAICIDVCTTNVMDDNKLHSNLINLKHDEELKYELIDMIYQVYESKSLVNVLALLLNINSEERISIRALVNNEFVQECLESIDSDLVNYIRSNDHDIAQLPDDLVRINSTLDYLIANIENESVTYSTLMHLEKLVFDSDVDRELSLLNEKSQYMFYKLMKLHANNERMQTSVFRLIEVCLCSLANDRARNVTQRKMNFISAGYVEQFFYVFLKYDRNEEIQVYGLKCFVYLSNFDNISNKLATYDIIKYFLNLLKSFESNPIVCAFVCKAIWSLSTNEAILKTLSNKKCLGTIKNVIETHKEDQFCVEMAIKVVIAMSINERQLAEEELDVDMISTIIDAFRYHLESNKVVESACIAFCSLIGLYEESTFRFVSVPASIIDKKKNSTVTIINKRAHLNGIDLLKLAYSIHKDNSRTVECICDVFKELSNYDEMIAEMLSMQLNETLLYEIVKRYRDDYKISETCSSVIAKIEARTRENLSDQE